MNTVEMVWSAAEELYNKTGKIPTQSEITAAAIAKGVDKYEANNRARSWLIFMNQFTKAKEFDKNANL